ncbi:Periplasmic component of the Tol biopolymer transport system [Prosthecobacter debontii]|uniref:Periplasmic component of the Tol biopolymer transport system n=1 Tax=Prosthecobacter debontii TaxID=48467 RepID=A0A1T4Z5E0_9BACT|nr:M28 family peptidase [Prosthecobacter debontii]SKB09224.1 Periplasmic component of the Tol biopolymer transport system [Prosthecobacter debontii]
MSMRLRLLVPLCLSLPLAPALAQTEADYLTNARQLTFEGRRSGEGYFSADGTKMVFQSEREEGNPFYQIYLMDLETGDQERISPGMGKTTCAWMHPDGKRILFASTHTDPKSKELQAAEYKDRETSRVRKYSWDYDEHYDIWEYTLADRSLKNLTQTQGYDAEGAYSPDGKSIVFASNRAAYQRKLSTEDEERLKVDKQYFMDIYVADADGQNVRQLTDVPGYDGGPFFSADGKRICWRRFTPKGDVAEVWTMNVDGSDAHPVTKLGAMSWAPYFHPSGDYLIFTTNLNGFANFELYIVDAAGKHEPVRVTTTDGFDGLPVFSPDGQKLSWTSGRTSNGQSQIFMADWNDAAARKALGLVKGEPSSVKEVKKVEQPDFSLTKSDITPTDLRQHVTYLASDELDGRLTGTEGEKLATQYVADVFKGIGLVPYGDEAWFEPFEFTAGVALGDDNRLSLQGAEEVPLTTDKDWRPLSFSQLGEVAASDIVFAGYGVETPDSATGEDGKPMETYSSYAHLEVKDKWVMVFRYLPEGISKDRRNELTRYASLRHKALVARQKGARGLIIVSGPNSKVVQQLVPMSFDASLASSGIAAISITDALANRLLKPAGKTVKELQDKLDTGDLMGGINCEGLKLSAKIDIRQEKKTGRNVLGVLPARDQPDPHVAPLIVCAHIDHLGSKGGSNSRAKGDEANMIHHGADDNASGVAGVIEIAQWLADLKKQGKIKLTRDVIFATWSGEELGLLGSSHYVEALAKMFRGDPNGKLTGMFAACLNMDMIGRFQKTLVLQGVGSSTWWPKEIEKRNAPIGLPITTQTDAYLPTDSTIFYQRGIPTLNAFTGSHEDYHKPSDTADKIDYDNAAKITRLMGLIARGVATADTNPDFVAMEAPKNKDSRGGLRAYLGTIPDYAQGDIKGVKLSGVSPVGPAGKAGVKGGDIIIKLGGKEVLNIYDYTSLMGELKIGQETTITVLRAGQEVELKITPGSRE